MVHAQSISPAVRAGELVAQMTLEEKAGLTSGLDFWHTKGVARLGVQPVMMTDGPHGLRKELPSSSHADIGRSVPATCFPPAATLGSTWDPALIERLGEALGAEARANDVAVVLGPGVNMKRSPLCGRNFEYFAEDPLLAGEAGAAIVAGIQSQGVGASLKHFAANNQETDRMRVDAQVSERALREIYLPAFERVVKKSRPWTVMCSYNKVNGSYASQNPWLLTTVLRQEWGFGGMVVSDWGAVDQRVPGLTAGLDLQMPAADGVTDAQIVAAIRAGDLDEAVLDAAATRVLTMILRGHDTLDAAGYSYDAQAHHALAREAAAAGTVLLRNDEVAGVPVLPLNPAVFSPQAPLVVIGEFARTPRYQGAGSSQINPTRLDTAVDALALALGAGAVRFEPGYRLAQAAGRPGQEHSGDDLLAAAVDAARDATAVVIVGLPQAAESEGYDRQDMDLPAEQIALVRAVSQVARRTVVVLVNGSAVSVSDWDRCADALVECWLGGQAGGAAIADVLTGAVAPSGHLAESIPLRLSDLPAQLNFPGTDSVVRYGEDIFIGYRGLDAMDAAVAYPFGHGLTYTSFELRQATVRSAAEQDGVHINEQTGEEEVVATVHARLVNTGHRTGAQVVQVYVGRAGASRVARAPRELRGFTKVVLEPGASRDIELPLTRRGFSYWDAIDHSWQVEAGDYEVSVGFSSRDLAFVLPLRVHAPALIRPLSADSTLGEWLNHPVGKPMMLAELPAFAAALDADPGIATAQAATPANRLAAFLGPDFDQDAYLRLVLKLLRPIVGRV